MRWKCICAYDGTEFDGWQRQLSGRAIQNVLELALSKVLDVHVLTHGSGYIYKFIGVLFFIFVPIFL